MGSRQDRRNKLLNGLYWFVVIIIAGAALSHSLTGFPSNQVVHPLYWTFMGVCLLGLINALGFFDKGYIKRIQRKALIKLAEAQNRALVDSIERIQAIETFLRQQPEMPSASRSKANVALSGETESNLRAAVQELEKAMNEEFD